MTSVSVMAFLCKNVLRSALATKHANNASPAVFCKRFMRMDPEEELENLCIRESFQHRVKQTKPEPITPEVIGTSFAEIKTQLTTSTTRSTRISSLPAMFEGPTQIPLNEVQAAHLLEADSTQAIDVLNHYNIFTDLFEDDVIFYPNPEVGFKVAYSLNEDEVLPVFRGNFLAAEDTVSPPLIVYNGKDSKMYSVLMVSLDGHLEDERGEYLHWSCLNMSGEDGLSSGNSSEYLQAIPLRGTGYHRYVFLLLEHDSDIDTSLLPDITKAELKSRTFKFSKFYSQLSDDVKPVGVQFFQCEWDKTVRQAFLHTLDMPEPAYEYCYPPTVRKPQIKYPHQEEFNLYLDRYRDRKEIAEEVIKEHLREITPYKSLEDQRLPYPLATPTKPGYYVDQQDPTWLKKVKTHKINKTGKYKFVYSEDVC